MSVRRVGCLVAMGAVVCVGCGDDNGSGEAAGGATDGGETGAYTRFVQSGGEAGRTAGRSGGTTGNAGSGTGASAGIAAAGSSDAEPLGGAGVSASPDGIGVSTGGVGASTGGIGVGVTGGVAATTNGGGGAINSGTAGSSGSVVNTGGTTPSNGEGGHAGMPGTAGGGGGSAPACVLPQIADGSTCRPANVLVLSDFANAVAGDTNSVSEYLAIQGFNVTTGPYYADYDGATPSLHGMDVVLGLAGRDFMGVFTSEAATAIQSFVAAGGGLILTEWAAYAESDAADLGLMPVSYAGCYSYGSTWQAAVANHPLTRDLPLPYTSPSAGWSCVTLHDDAVAPIVNDAGYPIVSYTNVHGGTTIHLNHDVHYKTDSVSATELVLCRNAVYFAAIGSVAPTN